MTTPLDTFLARSGPAILVEIAATKGSAPRETDAFMLVAKTGIWGTIGGGQLEFVAIDHARAMLDHRGEGDSLDIPLGPEIGQCCGGRVEIAFSRAEGAALDKVRQKWLKAEQAQPEVWLFGAGHVGKALADALALLPVKTFVVETRESELQDLPSTAVGKLAAMPEALVRDMTPGSALVILTHDHALDFMIAEEALARSDLAYVGMIGSKTKRATFAGWFARQGGRSEALARLVLPIGGTSVRDKRPEMIAAMTVAEILGALAAYGNR